MRERDKHRKKKRERDNLKLTERQIYGERVTPDREKLTEKERQ